MKAAVIGGGSWGSAFSIHLGRLNISTKLWIKEEEICHDTKKTGENRQFLPGIVFPPSVSFFMDLKQTVQEADFVFIAVPSRFCRRIYEQLAPFLNSRQIIISLTKGIEADSLKRMSEVMEEVFSPFFAPQIAVLSGPSFAREVAESHPTVVVVASQDLKLAKEIQAFVSGLYFRAYSSTDIIGVELAGACKNVIAIATGISDGFKFGSNSMAGLVTRGLAEMTRLGIKLGANLETYAGLAGIGDLVLTCTGKLSRNRFVGCELGKGMELEKVVSGMHMIAEGISTTLSVHQLSQREGVEMPISEQVYHILYERKNPREAFRELMSRELKNEFKTIKGDQDEI
jgi:glycerol-3-phosphate dehydrogenase (NAD(P)+)